MKGTIRKIPRTVRQDGFVKLCIYAIRQLYDDYFRERLPRTVVSYNGVQVRNGRLFESVLPGRNPDNPTYEQALLASLRTELRRGAAVVIVGGGWGVSSVVAARSVGAAGRVVTFEGEPTALSRTTETLRLNDVSENVQLINAVVGELVGTEISADESVQTWSPSELPDCDVLSLDCEGAEVAILSEMTIEPETIIVETHDFEGGTREAVIDLVEERGYKIVRESEVSAVDGIHVLVAKRTS